MNFAAATAPAPLLDLRHLTKRYGALTALRDVSLSLHGGEVLGLIGPNGAGKTTLFECVAGLLPADGGTVTISRAPTDPLADAPDLFYLPDAITPWPAQTVRWALTFILDLFGGHETIRDEVIARLALHDLLSRRIGTLSKGQRKRVLLALGLVSPHAILLVDEPFEGLDLRQTREIAGLLRGQVAWGRTLLLSIHQIADAARVCDRFVLLSSGEVRGAGTVAELAAAAHLPADDSPPSLEDAFLALT